KLFGGDFKGAWDGISSTGGILSLIGGGIIGYFIGGAGGAASGATAGGLLLSELLNGLLQGALKSYAPPTAPGADPDVLKRGPNKEYEKNKGYTLSPNLERIKKLDFEVGRLISQTDEAERIKDVAHRTNAFKELDRKYTEWFKLEANFNEYVRLAKEYN